MKEGGAGRADESGSGADRELIDTRVIDAIAVEVTEEQGVDGCLVEVVWG
jgi:hypothetical protein